MSVGSASRGSVCSKRAGEGASVIDCSQRAKKRRAARMGEGCEVTIRECLR